MRNFIFLLLLVTLKVHSAASIVVTWDAENGTVGAKPPAPLTAVTGPNIPLIDDNPVFAGSKSYDVYLNKNRPTILGAVQNPYRTEFRGGVTFEFEREYWVGFAFRRSIWDTDTSAESWPVQVHEAPSTWTNWGTSPCTQSASATAPIIFMNVNGQMQFKNLNNVLWTKPIDTGVWHTMVLHFKWSKGTTGFIESWYDNVQQTRYPVTGTRQTHRADSALNAFCGPDTSNTGDVTFVPPLLALGVYKWDWKIGSTQTSLTTIRQGSLDSIKVAQDIAGDDDAGGFALVNPLGVAPDTTPPTINSITESLLTSSGLTITSIANEAANVTVNYGTTTAYGSSVVGSTFATTQTSVLTNLSPSTLYNYRVTRCDASGNCTVGSNRTFTTAATTATYSNITVSGRTSTGYTVTWTTSVPRTSVLSHGPTTAYELTPVTDGTLLTSHSLTVSGLTPSTVYNFKLSGLDGVGADAGSANQTIRTLHSITSVSATNVTTTGFTCNATTSEAATSTCNYGLTTAYGSSRTRSGTRTAQAIDLTPAVGITLTPATVYHWQYCGVNGSGDNACTADQTTTTASDSTVITGVVVSKTSTTITFTWDTPVAANSIVKYGLRYGVWTTQTDATLVTTGHSVTITGLTPNTAYAVLIRSEVASGTPLESAVLFVKTKTSSGLFDTPFSWLDEFLEAA